MLCFIVFFLTEIMYSKHMTSEDVRRFCCCYWSGGAVAVAAVVAVVANVIVFAVSWYSCCYCYC